MQRTLPEKDTKILKQIVDVIKQKKTFLITTHNTLDGDAISCEIALFLLLKRLGKKAEIINQDTVPRMYSFLPEVKKTVKTYNPRMKFRKTEVTFILDCGTITRIGKVKKLISPNSLIINIDHHFMNEKYGDINWVNSSSSSCGEMLFFLLKKFGKINVKQAKCLYTAILTDTGSFRYQLGNDTFSICQELKETGVDTKKIAVKVYFERPLNSVKLLNLCLNTLKYDRKSKSCWIKVTREMYEKVGAGEEETEGFIDFVKTVKEAKVIFSLREKGSDVKVSFRSKGAYDVNELAGHFGGGGHREAAGCFVKNSTIEEVEKKILKILNKK